MKKSSINKFSENIKKILSGEEVNLYESRIDSSFEYISAEILSSQLQNGIWFDGTGDLSFKIINENQIDFFGNMHVCLEQREFWREPFFARVIDGREKGMPIFVRIGDKEGECDLFKIEWLYKNT